MFIELQFIGNKVLKHTIEANQYPEILRIKDMLDLTLEGIEIADPIEVEAILLRAN